MALIPPRIPKQESEARVIKLARPRNRVTPVFPART